MHMTWDVAVPSVPVCAVPVPGVLVASMVAIVVVAMVAMPGRSRHQKTSLVTK